jgi:hypothetical protein
MQDFGRFRAIATMEPVDRFSHPETVQGAPRARAVESDGLSQVTRSRDIWLEMTSSETTVLQKVVLSALARRDAPGPDAAAVAAAARRAYDDLAAVLIPLISQAGLDALVARALHLAQRQYPSDQAGKEHAAEPFGQVSLWLERQDPTRAAAAAAAMFATFAALLADLIGEPLTTRYFRKAWPDDFSDTRPEGTQA